MSGARFVKGLINTSFSLSFVYLYSGKPLLIEKPLIIIGAPRSGTTILFRCLGIHEQLWHLPTESHSILEGPFHPFRHGFDSNRVTDKDLDAATAQTLHWAFYRRAINLNRVTCNPAAYWSGRTLVERIKDKIGSTVLGVISRRFKPECIRLLEKTPKNALRVSMLAKLFPDAYFIWNIRRAAPTIDSIAAGWFTYDQIGPYRRERFASAGYPIVDQLQLTDYNRTMWKFALVPQWKSLAGRSIFDVAAWQYYQTMLVAKQDFTAMKPANIFRLYHEDFVEQPAKHIIRIFEWVGLPPSERANQYANSLRRIGRDNIAAVPLRSRDGLRFSDQVHKAISLVPGITILENKLYQDHLLNCEEGFEHG